MKLEVSEKEIKEIYHRGMFGGILIGIMVGMLLSVVIISVIEKDPKQIQCSEVCRIVPK